MSFYPDGETHIPNQTPVPGVAEGSQPGPTPGVQEAPPRDPQQLSKALTRAAVINAVLLAAAVLLAYVFPVSDDPNVAIAIIVVAALLSGVHLTVVLMRQQRRRGAVLDAAPAPPAPSSGYPSAIPAGMPYGAAPVMAATGGGRLTVEDVFAITGRGTVVTGRVSSGVLTAGQRVQILRNGQAIGETEITGVEMFRKQTDSATAGDNAGLLLAGISRDQVQRGDEIAG